MDRANAMALYRIRQSIDDLKKEDVSLPVYKVMEAIFAWMEMSNATAPSASVMSLSDLMAATGAQAKKDGTSKEESDRMSEQIKKAYL